MQKQSRVCIRFRLLTRLCFCMSLLSFQQPTRREPLAMLRRPSMSGPDTGEMRKRGYFGHDGSCRRLPPLAATGAFGGWSYFSLATHPAAASMPHAAAASRHSRRSGPAAASARDAPRTVRPCRPWSAEPAERNVADRLGKRASRDRPCQASRPACHWLDKQLSSTSGETKGRM